jgi:hypothetical protein
MDSAGTVAFSILKVRKCRKIKNIRVGLSARIVLQSMNVKLRRQVGWRGRGGCLLAFQIARLPFRRTTLAAQRELPCRSQIPFFAAWP